MANMHNRYIRDEMMAAALVGLLMSALAVVVTVVLAPLAERAISEILWLSRVPEDISFISPGSLLFYPGLWIPYIVWGSAAGVVTAGLARHRSRYTRQFALPLCLFALLVHRGWFLGLIITLTHLPDDWRFGTVNVVNLMLELCVASLLVLGMPIWLNRFSRPVHDFLHYGR